MNYPASPARLRALAAELAELKSMCCGSLSERTVKCGKPGCHCGEDPEARHGPYFSLTRAVKGKPQSRFLTSEQAAVVRQQIEKSEASQFNLSKRQDWPSAALIAAAMTRVDFLRICSCIWSAQALAVVWDFTNSVHCEAVVDAVVTMHLTAPKWQLLRL
jgi:hypothetical protein